MKYDGNLHKHRLILVRYAMYLGYCLEEAEDITHQVLLKALEKGMLEEPENVNLPYLKKMVKNRFLDERKFKQRFSDDPDFLQMAEYLPDDNEDKSILEAVRSQLEHQKYGYIILEMEKRNIKKVKDLAPYTNEKKDKLYKRYQKLLKDLKNQFRGGGVRIKKLILRFLCESYPILNL